MQLSGAIPHHIKMSDLVLRLAGDATVRGATTTEGIQVFAFYSVTLRNAANNKPYDTPAMTLRGLQRLVQILGDKVAADFRVLVVGTFTRFQAGDTSMIEEIHSNAASSAPIHQAYRQALTQEPVVDEAGTKRQLEREDALFELEIQERNLAIHERKLALEERKPADRGLDADSNAQSASAAEKHSMKCVRVQSLVSTSYSSHPDRSYSSHPSECLRDKQRRRNVFLKALSKEKHFMKCVCEH